MDTIDRECPECGRLLTAIKLLDNARYGVRLAQGELTYAAPEAKRSF
jgi:hypothetical protein